MAQYIPKILLWLFVINLGIVFGAGLYEARIAFPQWLVYSAESGYRWNAEAVSVESDPADDTFHDAPVLRAVQRPEPQAVHGGDGSRAHREDVPKNAAHAGGCALKRFDVGRVIVRLDLESNSQTVSDVDDAGVLAGALQDGRPFRRQAFQMDA